jgi:hypothetical protein
MDVLTGEFREKSALELAAQDQDQGRKMLAQPPAQKWSRLRRLSIQFL